MPLTTSDMPGEEFVETATAAPGEKRNVKVPDPAELCGKPVRGLIAHPCDREKGHTGKHSYRGE